MKVFNAAAAVVLGTLAAMSAGAQYSIMPSVIGNVIGQMAADGAEAECLRGNAPAVSEIAEARNPALAVMVQYFAAAQSGQSKATAFHLGGKAALILADRRVGAAGIDQAADPVAQSGNALGARPLRFYRSPLDASALGQWAVLDRDGKGAGAYTAYFVRRARVWKLRELTISRPGEKLAPAMQFCHAPGDVVRYKLDAGKYARELSEKRLGKARKRLAAIAGRSADAIEAARLRADVVKREGDLGKAQQLEREAQEEQSTIERLTVDASDAATLEQQ